MGVTALLVIPLMHNQELWGLISGHHQTPKFLSYEVRSACEFLGQIVSLELASKIIHAELDYQSKLQSLQSEVLTTISRANNFTDALLKPERRLPALVGAQGAAVCLGDEITLIGATPTIAAIRALLQWADSQVGDALFYTNSLPKHYPAAAVFKDTASGLALAENFWSSALLCAVVSA